MMKVRIQFSKKGALRFIGHLDFLRVFGQALRRSGLPLAYSQGFNPHILLGFALPLPLGMASIHDYVDITFTKKVCLTEASRQIQKCAPAGLEIINLFEYEGRSAAAITTAADYILIPCDENNNTGENIKRLLTAQEWIIPKKTKSGIKNTDIRADIFNISTRIANEILTKIANEISTKVANEKAPEGVVNNVITLRLAAGNGRFLHPAAVAKIILGRDVSNGEIIRSELYAPVGESFIPLNLYR